MPILVWCHCPRVPVCQIPRRSAASFLVAKTSSPWSRPCASWRRARRALSKRGTYYSSLYTVWRWGRPSHASPGKPSWALAALAALAQPWQPGSLLLITVAPGSPTAFFHPTNPPANANPTCPAALLLPLPLLLLTLPSPFPSTISHLETWTSSSSSFSSSLCLLRLSLCRPPPPPLPPRSCLHLWQRRLHSFLGSLCCDDSGDNLTSSPARLCRVTCSPPHRHLRSSYRAAISLPTTSNRPPPRLKNSPWSLPDQTRRVDTTTLSVAILVWARPV